MNEWVEIKGYEGHYLISREGKVKSIPRVIKTSRGDRPVIERIIKPFYVNGYVMVYLQKNKSSSRHRAHRLVAESYIDNSEGKPYVNHINGVKTDNRVENLEWCTHQENLRHASVTGLMKNCGKSFKHEDILYLTYATCFIKYRSADLKHLMSFVNFNMAIKGETRGDQFVFLKELRNTKKRKGPNTLALQGDMK